MTVPRQSPVPDDHVHRTLGKLKQAEVDLIAAIAPGTHPNNTVLLEAHALLWELITMLSKAESNPDKK